MAGDDDDDAGFEKTMTARVGRDNQVYSAVTGARVVAGTVVLSADRKKVLVISSDKKPEYWVLPKGGVEKDEETDMRKTAKRETWEEAGVTGEITRKLGVIEDMRPPKAWISEGSEGKWPPRTEFHFYEMVVERIEDKWPEDFKRKRKWVPYNEAVEEMLRHDRKELAEALKQSSLIRD